MANFSVMNELDLRLRFLNGGGAMGSLIRQYDWVKSELGLPQDWPVSLKTAVGIMLNSAAPVYIAWGTQFTQLYNDAYSLILGGHKHPEALGQSTFKTWHEIRDFLEPLFNSVISTGNAISRENQELLILRNSYIEECFFNLSYSPLTDEFGVIRGVIVTCLETTEKFIDARRSKIISRLVENLSKTSDINDVRTVFKNIITDYPEDIPFGLWYEFKMDSGGLDLVAFSGIEEGTELSPKFINPQTDVIYSGILSSDAVLISEVPVYKNQKTTLNLDVSQIRPDELFIKPIRYKNPVELDAYFMIGVNPMRPNDDAIMRFLKEVTRQFELTANRLSRNNVERLENRHQYESMMDNLPCLVWMTDVKNECILFNYTWLNFRGRKYEEELAYGRMKGIHPDDLDKVEGDFLNALKLQSKLTLEYRLLHTDGSYRWILDQSTPRYDVKGLFLGYIGTCLDVTESKTMDLKLQQLMQLRLNEINKNNTIFDALPIQIAILNSNGQIISVNETWRIFTSENSLLAPSQTIGANYLNICESVLGDESCQAKNVAAGILSVINGEIKSYSIEYSCHSQTEKRWFLMIASPIIDNHNNGAVIMHINVTAERQAEKNLRESDLRFRQMAENINDVFFLQNIDKSQMYYVSPGYEKVFGNTCESLYLDSKSWMNSIHPDDLEGVITKFKEGMRSEVDYDFRILLLDAELRWIQIRTFPILDDIGNIYRIAGVAKDVTQSKQALQKLNESDRRFTCLMQNVELLSLMLDIEARVIYCNEYMLRLTGWRYEEIIGRNYFELFIASENADLKLIWLELIYSGLEAWHRENEILTRTGIPRLIRWSTSLLRSESGNVIGTASIGADITEQKQSEAEILKLNAKLEQRVTERTIDLEQARNHANEANLAKSRFLATMSHEIRTPMNGIIGMTEVLQHTHLNDDQQELVDLISESGFSLLTIINDILDFSKIEAGRLEIEQLPLSLMNVVEKSCSLLDQLALKSNVVLTMFIDPKLPKSILGDELRIRQILLNLIGNGIKFSSGRQQVGQVSVRVTLNQVSSNKDVVEFQVTDNGIGMDEEAKARLFTAFIQADSTTTRRFGGTGLGLAISSHLAVLMGGNIQLQSSYGNGSTFTVILPFIRELNDSVHIRMPSEVAGVSCISIGNPIGLAKDICDYLAYGEAYIEYVENMEELQVLMQKLPSKIWIWIIDRANINISLPELRVLAGNFPTHEIRFVLIGRGERRKPHVKFLDLILIDGNVLTRNRLFKAVALAAGRISESNAGKALQVNKSDGLFESQIHSKALRNGQIILVAEDNQINQKVIKRQLGLMGFAVEVADNGYLALELWKKGHYAMLLTDLEMPEMDGYELAAKIRCQENGLSRMPIVALTANVINSEKDRCIAAGIDDYLSKPVALVNLKSTLEKWLATTYICPDLRSEVDFNDISIHLDISVLKNLIGDDDEIIIEFLNDFQINAAKIGLELRMACNDRQAVKASKQAHKLKSSARSVGALVLGDICSEMEATGLIGDIKALKALLLKFEHELNIVNVSLFSLMNQYSIQHKKIYES